MRILALDWGTVRMGAAISDPDAKIAFPLDHYLETKNALNEIKNLVQAMDVGKIVIGMPKSLSGQDSNSSNSVKQFIQRLQDAVDCEIDTMDERFSSVAAHKVL